MSSSLRIAVAQACTTADWRANAEQCLKLIDCAADDGADLVVLPEAALARTPNDQPPIGQALDGPFLTALADRSARHHLTVVVGTLVPEADGRVRNTCVVLQDGRVRAAYDKLHLYDAFGFRESDRVIPGDGPVLTFDVGGLTAGVMICYDLRFPEMARALAQAGAELILMPAAWFDGDHKLDHWRTLCRARALENGCYLAAAGSTGPERTGHSLVVDPRGVVVAELGREVGVAPAMVMTAHLEVVRQESPLLAQRRFAFNPQPTSSVVANLVDGARSKDV